MWKNVCVPQDMNSFVEFRADSGVEVCTFWLIVKNASSFPADGDPINSEAESKPNDLIRSVVSLNGMKKGNRLSAYFKQVYKGTEWDNSGQVYETG
ncbi:Unknown protein [Striga hermonthica]|uniref:Uncharacterized protein n=1 Tax=Striga hermonthica TaxID=68872 RepID=A0A9N7NZH0_STRHE|nr:Unknown protein [Striga hermonthica]